MKISRADVLQGFLSLFDAPRYLEVGVSKGMTFHALEAARKVAVDPRFRFDAEAAARDTPNASYHEVPSDEYFGKLLGDDRFDVIYLDGMHTLEQTLRDLTNALAVLEPGGVIVIDDVYPISYVAAIRDIETHRFVKQELNVGRGAWMGDVYRLVFFVDSFFQQLSYRTIADNHGQLVVWGAPRDEVPDRRLEDVARLPYEAIVLEKEVFRFRPYAEILEEVRAFRAGESP